MSDFSDDHTLRDGVRHPLQDTLEELRPVPGAPALALQGRAPIWRRLWFLISVVPRYLISGSIEVP